MKCIRNSFFGFLIVILLSALPVWAATYYVDATNGDDYNDGLSISTAWKTIAKVKNSSFDPGDQILFKKGEIWREQLRVSSFGSPGNPIIFGAYGSGPKPVISGADIFPFWSSEPQGTFVAYYASVTKKPQQVFEYGYRLTEVSGKALLIAGSWWYDSDNDRVYMRTSGDDNPSGYTIERSARPYSILISGKNYITIDGIEATKAKTDGIRWENGSHKIIIQNCNANLNYRDGIKMYADEGYINNTGIIQDCETSYNGRNGIVIGDRSDNQTIRRNHVHHNCTIKTYNFTAGIKGYGRRSNNYFIEENLVCFQGLRQKGDRGHGIWVDTMGSGGFIRKNRVYNNNLGGIFIESTSNTGVYYNLVYNNPIGGIIIAVGGGGEDTNNNKVYNNTVYGKNDSDIGLMLFGEKGCSNCFNNNIITNNIVVNAATIMSAKFGGDNDGDMGSGNIYSNNCFGVEFSNFIEFGHNAFKSAYDAWENAYGGSTNSVAADPLFKNIDAVEFGLRLNSPCIDAGQNVGLSSDFANNHVPQGESADIGAFEYGSSISIAPPCNLRIISNQ